MVNITYSMIMQFLTSECGDKQTAIADCLSIDKSTISKVVNGKSQLSKDITAEDFLRKIFGTDHICLNKNKIIKLYCFLENQNVIDKVIHDEYTNLINKLDSTPEKEEQFCKSFMLIILNHADDSRAKGFFGEKIEHAVLPMQTNPSIENDAICFKQFNNPLIEDFIGRDKLMIQLRETLDNLGLAIICGIGGLGKSQSALKYAFICSEEGKYSHVQRIFFDTSLKMTLLKINFKGLKVYQETDEEQVNIRLSILQNFDSNTLLIIDNMDAPLDEENEQIMKRLQNMNFHLLITSRETDLAADKFMIQILPLSHEEQLNLFKKHYALDEIPQNDIPAYLKIFEKIEGHTMLIELIAKTMRENVMTPEEMLDSLAQGDDSNVSEISIEKDNNRQQDKMYKYVSSLFDISNINDEDKSLLINLTLSSIVGLRLRVLKQFLLKVTNMDVVNRLIYQSWLIRDKKSSALTDRIHLHSVIRTAIIHNTNPSLKNCQEYIESTISTCYQASTDLTDEDRQDLYDILINAGDMFMTQYGPSTINLLKSQAEILQNAHKYTSALKQYKRVINIYDNITDIKYNADRPKMYRVCADLAVKLADYDLAISNYKEAISIWECSANTNYIDVVDVYNQIANVYRKASKYTLALDAFQQAETIMDVHSIDVPSLKADIWNNIGIVYINLDNLDSAFEHYNKAKEIRENQPEPDNKKLAYSYHNIGTVYQRKKEYTKAIDWHNRGLQIRKKVCKNNDPSIADSLTMIGNDYAGAAEQDSTYTYDQALSFIEEGLAIRKEILGPNHPATAWSYESIGRVKFSQTDFSEALVSFHKCLDIRKNSLGEEHAYTAEIMQWISKTYIKLNQESNAKPYLLQANIIQGKVKPSAQAETIVLLDEIKHRKDATI